MTEGSHTHSKMMIDDYYMQEPACVICQKTENSRLYVNSDLTGRWLRWRALPGASRPDYYHPGDVSLGNYGHYELFVDPAQQEKLAKFALFVLAAATQSDTSGGSSAGGGASTSGGGGSRSGGGGPSSGGPGASSQFSAPAPLLLVPNQ
jgi:uncharacterized membrane protein YgcG